MCGASCLLCRFTNIPSVVIWAIWAEFDAGYGWARRPTRLLIQRKKEIRNPCTWCARTNSVRVVTPWPRSIFLQGQMCKVVAVADTWFALVRWKEHGGSGRVPRWLRRAPGVRAPREMVPGGGHQHGFWVWWTFAIWHLRKRQAPSTLAGRNNEDKLIKTRQDRVQWHLPLHSWNTDMIANITIAIKLRHRHIYNVYTDLVAERSGVVYRGFSSHSPHW